MIKKTGLVVAVFFTLAGFGQTEPESLLEKFNTAKNKISSDDFKFENCEPLLNAVSEDYAKIRPQDYKRAAVEAVAFKMIEVLWSTRTSIRSKLMQFYMNAKHDEACTVAVRVALRTIRGVEDYLGNLVHTSKTATLAKGEKYPHPTFIQSQSSDAVVNYPGETLINPKFRVAQVRSGDILISRGGVFSSALIARMPDVDAQFSHMAMVYIDPIGGKKYTIEAHIEVGAIVIPFEEYFKDGKSRSSIYRYHDPKVAHAAAFAMFKRVGRNMLKGKNVPYDFKMLSNDHRELFCSEVIREGFKKATNDQALIPLYMSRFTMKNRDLLNRLGTNVQETFMPGDIEGDPRFEQIAEWRNYSLLKRSWTFDALITKMYEWMEKYNYRIHDTFKGNFGKNLIYDLRHTPFVGDLLRKKLPLNMSKNVLATMIVLDSVTAHLMDVIDLKDQEAIKKTGFPKTLTQIKSDLDEYRDARPRLHNGFRI